MDIIISNSSGSPIYEQIVSQIKGKIISGEMAEGDALPSIRLLAKELEREGFIVTQPGRGSFVAGKNLELIKEEHLRQLEELLAQSCRLAADCGLSLEELEEMLRLVYEGD